jgi:uracil-DNA glycosylase family 4
MSEQRKLVMGNGSAKSRIMIIGEAPGANEDRLGEPFVGKAGSILNEALSRVGVPRPAVYVTNIYKHRPPDNRPPTLEEMMNHAPMLISEFESVRPKHVLLLGNTSLKFFTHKANIGAVHGTRISPDVVLDWEPWANTFWYATYHPAATIYNRNVRKDFYRDVKTFFEIAQGTYTTPLKNGDITSTVKT